MTATALKSERTAIQPLPTAVRLRHAVERRVSRFASGSWPVLAGLAIVAILASAAYIERSTAFWPWWGSGLFHAHKERWGVLKGWGWRCSRDLALEDFSS